MLLLALMCSLGLPQNTHVFNSHLNYIGVWLLNRLLWEVLLTRVHMQGVVVKCL